MKITANDVLKVAQSWIGFNEKNKTFRPIIDLYNTQKPLPRGYKVKYNDSWCATFITSLFLSVGGKELIYPECSCENMINGMKGMGIFIENENRIPNVGDIIFYDWDDNGVGDCKGRADHVGIVEKVNGKTITVIEGNKSEAVARRTIVANQKYIRGYGVPKYSTTVTTNSVPTPKKTVAEVAKEVVQGKWGNGSARQKALTQAGYNYSEVQKEVNKLVKRK